MARPRSDDSTFVPDDKMRFSLNFSKQIVQRGLEYSRERRVVVLDRNPDSTAYFAKVRGTELYEVKLAKDPRTGAWGASCTCPVGSFCKHIYAVFHEAFYRPGVSIGIRTDTGENAAPKDPRLVLRDELGKKLGRPLDAAEISFAGRVENTFYKLQTRKILQAFELQDLGIVGSRQNWNIQELWPHPPATDLELWLALASEAVRQRLSLPHPLSPVTDLEAAARIAGEMQARKEVEKWLNLFGDENSPEMASQILGQIDLRIRLRESYLELESCVRPQNVFAPVKKALLRSWNYGSLSNLDLTPRGLILWNLYKGSLTYEIDGKATYTSPAVVRLVNTLVRTPDLREGTVDEDGQPLAIKELTLKWSLHRPSSSSHYAAKLVRADGSPSPHVWLTLPGRPCFYLTAEGVYPGEGVSAPHLDPNEVNKIPVAALETNKGADFLRRLGVPLPEAFAARVRSVVLRPEIRGELIPNRWGDGEAVSLEIAGISADGAVRDVFTGTGWRNERTLDTPGAIVSVDRSRVQGFAPNLDLLGAFWDDISRKWVVRLGKKFAESFAAWLDSLPREIPVHLAGELAGFADSPIVGTVGLNVKETNDIDWFDLSVELKVEDTTLTPSEIKLLLSARGGWVRLQGRGWKRLQFNLTQEEDENLALLGLTAKELSDEPQRMHALQLAHPAARGFMPEAQAENLRRRASEIKTRVTPALPKGIKAELRPYQLEGFHFLSYLATNRFGGVLADDMGLGKTLQTLAWLAWLRAEAGGKKAAPSLVVCPKSVAPNWSTEAERFLPGLKVRVWSSHGLDTLHEHAHEADLHVLNYAQLRSAAESVIKVRWLAAILDEAQFIKNPVSQTAVAARTLDAAHRLALTGTPVENRLMDLWSIFSFTMPGVLGTKAEFAKLYGGDNDPLARRRLAARVRPFLLRRTKGQVARDLPDRIEEDLIVEMEGEQAKLYTAELKKARLMLLGMNTPTKLNKERFHVLSSLLRLRQICCDPRLVKANSKAGGAKNEALIETLSPLMDDGQKVLVFSQFTSQLDLLEKDLAKEQWKTFMLDGSTEDRGTLVKNFEAHEGAAVFLISLKAGGFGLNLVSASYVVLYDPWWNPAVENQAIDRTHRIGQTRQVVAYRLIAKDSIEEKIRTLQRKKSALANDLLGEEKFNESLTMKDLEFLLG